MKYPVASDKKKTGLGISYKKKGFFQSEKGLVEEIWKQTNLSEGVRHPLTYIMEACDDIAYSVLDAEDSVKKQLVSFSDLVAWLENKAGKHEALKWIIAESKKDHSVHRKLQLSPSELNDVSMQKFRVYAIHAMVSCAIKAFIQNYENIMKGSLNQSLIETSKADAVYKNLKDFSLEHGYKHKSVLKKELNGYNAIHNLMDMLWHSIEEHPKGYNSEKVSPFANYSYNRISENYRRILEEKITTHKFDTRLSRRYQECQLLTDMISGMADNFALDLNDELSEKNTGASKPVIITSPNIELRETRIGQV